MKDKMLVVGIGNTIRGDDGVGIHLARRLREILPPRFEVKELATAGLDLMEAISGYTKAILIDAIQTPDGMPGEVHHFSLDEFEGSFNLSSTHALQLDQVVALTKKLLGDMPEGDTPAGDMPERDTPQVEILAIEARRLYEFSEGLSPELEEKFDEIVETIRTKIEHRRHK